MSRKTAREVAMKISFARLLGGDAAYKDVLEKSELSKTPTEDDIAFADNIVSGIEAHCQELDALINDYAKNWTAERLPKVDLVILRIAFYELLYSDNPSGAVINEAVALAKRYCDDKSYQYINGILGSYVRKVGKV